MTIELPRQLSESITVAGKREQTEKSMVYPATQHHGMILMPGRKPNGFNPDHLEWGLELARHPYYTKTLFDLEKIEDLDVDKIRRYVGGLVLDVNGTLLGHGSAGFSPAVVEKLREIRAKMKVCVFPDNGEEYSLFHELRIPAVKHAVRKPHPSGFERAAYNYLDLKPEQCAMVGDDLLNDGAAKRTGMKMILVNPLPGSESIFYKMTRGYARAVKKIHDKMFRGKK